MELTINGKPRAVDDSVTLADLLADMFGASRGRAVAVDGEVVPRGDWTTFVLRDGHAVEILTAVQGG
jgi:sulfur carrier protein